MHHAIEPASVAEGFWRPCRNASKTTSRRKQRFAGRWSRLALTAQAWTTCLGRSQALSVRLLRTQRQFAQVMFVEFAVGVSGFVQRERARDVDFKRTGLDQTVEPLDLLGTWLDIVALDLHGGSIFE